jgi:hypothetical protein
MTAAPISSADHTVDSSPTENPDRIVVAGPVTVDSAISWTGLYFASVKYCVRTWISDARTRPITTAAHGRQSFVTNSEATKTITAERAAEMKNPRLIAFIPCSSSERGETDRIPTIDVRTPIARTQSGNITPAIAPTSLPLNAAAPRIREATKVTS